MKHLIACILLILTAPALVHANVVGQITSLNGTAQLYSGGENAMLMLDSPIHINDRIETAADSNLEIRFIDDSQLTIGSGSTVTIDRFVFTQDETAAQSAITVSKGFFRLISGQMPKGKTHIKTPVSTIGVRGTDFFGEVEENGTTAVGLVECCVDITTNAGTVSLLTRDMYSKATSRDALASEPAFCDPAWVERSANALGISKETLGYE